MEKWKQLKVRYLHSKQKQTYTDRLNKTKAKRQKIVKAMSEQTELAEGSNICKPNSTRKTL